ncbi:P2Y purinoceptor 1-like isoform X3 [Simochromis diagramma]|uniref:P2Y purinoceptor 1-like isoform X2 n=1 Tax=Simochromis diagramma TaxID=43689 RepID=UPI001A7EDDE9|nr:P2Y purinoceptor 1-like isoform X2 [Simochromis diagramma]XP_039894086.1 P2Y purinoceptor 1-like isoform X3 [Simochromis diagramma]
MSGIATNKTSFFRSNYEHVTLPAVYTFVFIIGLGANGWAVKSLLQKWKILGHINVFLLNLGVANFLFLPTLPFLSAYYFMRNKWIFGDAFCKITRFCFNLNLYGSIGFLTCISVYRYLAIVHPMRVMGKITVTLSVVISVLVWLLVSVQSLPDMFYPKTSANNTHTNRTEKCHHTTSTEYVENYLKYSVGWTLTGFVMPLLILLGCYGHVTLVFCRKNTINKVVKQRSLRLLFILILLFSVCYIPYHIFKNLSLYSRVLFSTNKKYPSWDKRVFCAHQISRGLVCLNSVLNPLVYLHVMDILAQLQQLLQRFRQTFTRLFVSNYVSVPVAQTANTAIS